MIDLHTHILPGIDDGADTFEEALEMCRRAEQDGCEAIVATPHQRHQRWWNCDGADLARLRSDLQEALGNSPRILAGGEIRVDDALLADVEAIPASGLQPLAGSRHLLVEFSRSGSGPAPELIVHELVVAGWRPVLAHPELLPWLAPDLARLEHLVELGGRLQVTAMSITGDFGRRPQDAARAMLDAGLPHFVASDMHGVDRRPPGLSLAYRALRAGWGREIADRLTTENPRRILADEAVEA
jgi:protein-tyrosine phosphatase